ncbi:acyltransferase [Cytobacillus oceanisediminis]|uniref:acyltransferase n=1 Tax=Cytobacillus oceanisediminis TaxID=665099 RepID=UPI001642BCF5|nr:acyltransferase [Cytobacillus oceanisediminis]
MIKKILFYVILSIINKVLKGTRFFKLKRFLFHTIGIEVGKDTKIVAPIYIGYINKLSMGSNCWIGKNLTIEGNGNVVIGDRCDLAPNVLINTGGHLIGDKNRRAGAGIKNNTQIESGTWIGTRVTIINGANIGESTVVAAGSVVIKNVENSTLVAGVPAKVKKVLD